MRKGTKRKTLGENKNEKCRKTTGRDGDKLYQLKTRSGRVLFWVQKFEKNRKKKKRMNSV